MCDLKIRSPPKFTKEPKNYWFSNMLATLLKESNKKSSVILLPWWEYLYIELERIAQLVLQQGTSSINNVRRFLTLSPPKVRFTPCNNWYFGVIKVLFFLWKTKAQLISKCFLGPSISSKKKRTNEFVFTSMRIVFVRFWRKSMTPKNHFEINWPLPIMEMLKNLSMISTQNTFYLISFHIRCHKSKILLFIAVDWFENSYIPGDSLEIQIKASIYLMNIMI